MSLLVELYGLEVEGRHGLEEAERSRPQRFLYDLWLEVPEASVSDRIEETVDYREVVACVRELSDSRQFHLLEAIAAALADELVARFQLERVRVRVRKPDVRLGVPVEWSAASVERPRP
ncbi:MAG TPA: dihydroneopterin aldolase [Gaiellaceae bacterium]